MEHDPLELGPRSRIGVTFFLVAVIAYALYTNSPLMAITFILIGVVGYLLMYRDPEMVTVHVTTRGIIVGKDFYEYDNIESFHLYGEPPFEHLLSLKTDGTLVQHIHVPIGETIDQDALRDALDQFIPADIHEPGLVDMLEKMLHI